MESFTDPPEGERGRRDLFVALAFLLLSGVTLYLPGQVQARVAETLRGTLLRPFIMTQEAVAWARLRTEEVVTLQARLDSLAAAVAAQADLAEENRRLRGLLDLQERAPNTFVHANVIRPGTAGSQGMFLMDVGSEDGVATGDPILMRSGRIGLLGVVREVSRTGSVGLDWSHPDFRASAMATSGETETFGMVEPRPAESRGGNRLLLTAIPYYEPLVPGTLVETSGLGGVFPRGIPIGEVWTLHRPVGNWSREYWLRPVVEPGAATHVLVARARALTDQIMELLTAPGDSLADASDRGQSGATGDPGQAESPDSAQVPETRPISPPDGRSEAGGWPE